MHTSRRAARPGSAPARFCYTAARSLGHADKKINNLTHATFRITAFSMLRMWSIIAIFKKINSNTNVTQMDPVLAVDSVGFLFG